MPLTNKPFPLKGSSIIFNTEAAYYFLTSANYRRWVEDADWLYCDGAGLQIYLRLRLGVAVRRAHGPDVMGHYLKHASDRRVVLLGGSDVAHEGLRRVFPDFFRRNQVAIENRIIEVTSFDDLAATIICDHKPDDVLIFLGLRKQEHFQNALVIAGFNGSSIGLGAAIDFLSGTKRRAGVVWQKLGLEWLPRMIDEPRMFIRVARSFALFLLVTSRHNYALKSATQKGLEN